jgi:ubiquitin-protein ligase
MASPKSAQASTDTKKRGREETAVTKHDPRALHRIARELKDAMDMNLREELAMEVELVDEADITRWRFKWFYDHATGPDATETQKRLAEQLAERELEFIEFRVVFPEDYPTSAPFVYNHYPHLKGSYVFSQGGICAETLSTKFGWSCVSRAYMLVSTVRCLLENAGCRLRSEHDYGSKAAMLVPNPEEGARRDKNAIEGVHSDGWHGSAGRG